jgi:hypothetical protein
MLTASVKLWFGLAAIALPVAGSGRDAAPVSLPEAVKMMLANNPLHQRWVEQLKPSSLASS